MTILDSIIRKFYEGRKGYLVLSNIKSGQPVEFYFDHPDPRKHISKTPRANKRTFRNRELKIRCMGVLVDLFGDGQALPKKNFLREQVEQNLGTKIPHKIFNEAYGKLFARKRGRPSKK